MSDLPQLQLIAQLIDNLDIVIKELEDSYNKNDAETFKKAKIEIVDIHDKISRTIR